jgi:hypothetical protein
MCFGRGFKASFVAGVLRSSETASEDVRREKRLALSLSIPSTLATIAVVVSGFFYGPHTAEMELPDRMCAFVQGNFVYVGVRGNRVCQWRISTDSTALVATALNNHDLQIRASWNAAQILFDGQLYEIGKFVEVAKPKVAGIYLRPAGA